MLSAALAASSRNGSPKSRWADGAGGGGHSGEVREI